MRVVFKYLVALIFSQPYAAMSWTLFLQQDMGIEGNYRYCKYSDGKVYTVNSTSLCKLQVEGSAPGFGVGVGFLKGERPDGMSKVCIYDVLGEKKGLRIDAATLCPLTKNF
jgi:hypothetical protein